MPETPEKPQIPAEMAQIRPEDGSISIMRLGNGWLVTSMSGMMFQRGHGAFGAGMVAETTDSLLAIIAKWADAQHEMALVHRSRELAVQAELARGESPALELDREGFLGRPSIGAPITSAAELDALCGGPAEGEQRTSGGFLADPGGFKPL